MAVTSEQIEKYNWNEPVSKNPEVVYYALEACIERNFPEQSQFDGAFMNGLPPKMEILPCRKTHNPPIVKMEKDGSIYIGDPAEGCMYGTDGDYGTLAKLVARWNYFQKPDDNEDCSRKARVRAAEAETKQMLKILK